MQEINLPKLEDGHDFEELITATFQASCYYVERNLILKEDGKEILEIDNLVSNYYCEPACISLCEAKSGKYWGFKDIFKLFGQSCYLNINGGYFIYRYSKEPEEVFKQRAEEMNITLVQVDEIILDRAIICLDDFLCQPESVHEEEVKTLIRYYRLENNIFKYLISKKKETHQDGSIQRFKALLDYQYEITSGIFFSQSSVSRLDLLFKVYNKYGGSLSAKIGNELVGNSFDEGTSKIPNAVFKETFYKGEFTDIQISSYLEHYNRLALIKASIDFVDNYDEMEDLDQFNFPSSVIPERFLERIKAISEQKYFRRYAIFWHWFMFVFGGYLVKDKIEEEYKILSEETEIPLEYINEALSSYEMLFPIEGGWFQEITECNIKVLKLFPIPFRGIGTAYRLYKYCNDYDESELDGMLCGKYTCKDLLKWHEEARKLIE